MKEIKIGDIFKCKGSSWTVKVVYLTSLEVCTEDLKNDIAHDTKFLSVFSRGSFLSKFELNSK